MQKTDTEIEIQKTKNKIYIIKCKKDILKLKL